MPKPMNMPPKINRAVLWANPTPAHSLRARMSKVRSASPVSGFSARKNSDKKLRIISAEPNSV